MVTKFQVRTVLWFSLQIAFLCCAFDSIEATPNETVQTILPIPYLAEDVGADPSSPESPSKQPIDVGLCSVYSLEARHEGLWGVSENLESLTPDGKKIECLERILEQGRKYCRRAVADSPDFPTVDSADFYDDCLISSYFLGSVGYAKNTALTPYKTYGCTRAFSVSRSVFESTAPCDIYYGGDFLFDASCNSVTEVPEEVEICNAGLLFWRFSPISLLWNGATDLDGEATVVSFPLNPDKSGKWYVWHASSSAPLLVYDPQHSGIVSSATQLFGPWALGGKRLASKDSSALSRSTWQDGYEALATLDLNRDGEVSNEELKPLALWFDANRNGVSDPGEVRSLADVGVTKLFYGVDRRDEKTGNIYASRGFERVESGKVRLGSSVDWYGEEGESRHDLLTKLLAAGALFGDSHLPASLGNSTLQTALPESFEAGSAKARIGFHGLWSWKANDLGLVQRGLDLPGGYFQFLESDDGKIRGYVLSETAFLPNFHLNSTLAIRHFSASAKIKAEESTRAEIRFGLRESNGAAVHNTAKLSNDGKKLLGTTKARVKNGATWVTVSYGWVAERSE